jgi:hypothetical protein
MVTVTNLKTKRNRPEGEYLTLKIAAKKGIKKGSFHMNKYFLQLASFFLSVAATHAQTTCADNLSWFEECEKSLFYTANSNHCKRQLVKDYAASLYYPLNRHLRGIEIDHTCGSIEDSVYFAMSSLKRSKARVFYRGVRAFPSLEKLNINDCFVDRGYLSTSLLEKKALGFTDSDQKLVFEITAQSGREILNKVGYKHEQEVIFMPNTPLKLTSIRVSTTQTEFGKKTERRYFFSEVPISECADIYH